MLRSCKLVSSGWVLDLIREWVSRVCRDAFSVHRSPLGVCGPRGILITPSIRKLFRVEILEPFPVNRKVLRKHTVSRSDYEGFHVRGVLNTVKSTDS